MVLYGVDDGSHVYSKSDSTPSDPYLVITTNVINDEILDSVDIIASRTMNIIFQCHLARLIRMKRLIRMTGLRLPGTSTLIFE